MSTSVPICQRAALRGNALLFALLEFDLCFFTYAFLFDLAGSLPADQILSFAERHPY